MRASKRRALTLSALLGTSLVWSGCESKKATEYVTGISTQVQVPRDLKTIRVDINVGGVPSFCRSYPVYDGKVLLPRSLGSFPVNDSHLGDPITMTVVGFTEDSTNAGKQGIYDCSDLSPIQAGVNARVLRRSRQPYRKDSILYLPMALRFSCFDVACKDDAATQTCKGGKCIDAAIDEKTLPLYSDGLVDGKPSSACFSAGDCMAAAVPPAVVDADKCIYAIPNTPSAPKVADGLPPNPVQSIGDGVNVRIVYDGGFNSEILDLDKDEGFTIPDPSKPQQIQLAPGLCEMLKGKRADGSVPPHRITGVFTSGTCQAKTVFTPLCEKDQLAAMGVDATGVSQAALTGTCNALPLPPTTAALLVVADSTPNSKNLGKDPQNVAAATLSLKDPAFISTTLGLMFYPQDGKGGGAPVCAGNTLPAGGFPLAINLSPSQQIVDQLLTRFFTNYQNDLTSTTLQNQTDLDGALDRAYAVLNASGAFKKGALVLANRDFGSDTCGVGGAIKRAGDAAKNDKIETYVISLTSNGGDPNAPYDLNAAIQLAIAGTVDQTAARGPYDARADKAIASNGFRQLVNDLATCAYDAPAALTNDMVITYTDPVGGKTSDPIAFNAACNTPKADANGWGRDAVTGKVIICGLDPDTAAQGKNNACSRYRNVRATAAVYAAQYLQPALAVPVFAQGKDCLPPTTGGSSGGSSSGGSSSTPTPTPTPAPSPVPDAGADASTALDAGTDGG